MTGELIFNNLVEISHLLVDFAFTDSYIKTYRTRRKFEIKNT